MKEKFNPNIVEINFEGIKEKIDLKEALITKNITPIELNKKLSILPAQYSFFGSLRCKLDVLIDVKEEEFNKWFAEAISQVDKKELSSEKAKEREVRNHKILGKKYDKFKEEIRELKYYQSLADIMRKGYNTQFFCIKEQVNLLLQKKNDISFQDNSSNYFKKLNKGEN